MDAPFRPGIADLHQDSDRLAMLLAFNGPRVALVRLVFPRFFLAD